MITDLGNPITYGEKIQLQNPAQNRPRGNVNGLSGP
jgi:hypothetical protein